MRMADGSRDGKASNVVVPAAGTTRSAPVAISPTITTTAVARHVREHEAGRDADDTRQPQPAAPDILGQDGAGRGHDRHEHRDPQGDRLFGRRRRVDALQALEDAAAHAPPSAVTRTTSTPGGNGPSGGTSATARARRRLTSRRVFTAATRASPVSAVAIVTAKPSPRAR